MHIFLNHKEKRKRKRKRRKQFFVGEGGELLKCMKRQHLRKLLGAQNGRIGKCRKIFIEIRYKWESHVRGLGRKAEETLGLKMLLNARVIVKRSVSEWQLTVSLWVRTG
jgi:hypothetical protein